MDSNDTQPQQQQQQQQQQRQSKTMEIRLTRSSTSSSSPFSSSCYYFSNNRRNCQRLASAFSIFLAILLYGVFTNDGFMKSGLSSSLSTSSSFSYEEPIEVYYTSIQNDENGDNGSNTNTTTGAIILPKALVDLGIYNPDQDFQNSLNISPPFWRSSYAALYVNKSTTTTKISSKNLLTDEDYELTQSSFLRKKNNNDAHKPPNDNLQTWGPCYPPHHKTHWKKLSTDKAKTSTTTTTTSHSRNSRAPFKYRHKPHGYENLKEFESVQGGCRPGFLIIGAGKCGTSSLYHYLVGHPRVAPAYSKQIHYFKYHLNKPLGWYYSWFPTAETFLETGMLMTGEASPGYLPYPDVVREVKMLMPGPKIIMVGRNPLERIYSSYRYNYVQPTLEAIKAGKVPNIVPTHKVQQQQESGVTVYDDEDDEYYIEHYLFSLEDMVRAELKQLRACLYGFGITATREQWYDNPKKKSKWTHTEFEAREHFGMDPLIDLDEVCYGDVVNATVLRPQWAELQMAHPNRVILNKNTFLTQAMIGRSLYALPLEWWYILFDPEDILFVCTEELSNPDTLNDLALQLGLPSYNFTDVIAKGAYNVGGHRGYDKATTWDEIQQEEEGEDEHNHHHQLEDGEGDEDGKTSSLDAIPLSEELRQEVLDFIRPFNERLFELTGKRCDWY